VGQVERERKEVSRKGAGGAKKAREGKQRRGFYILFFFASFLCATSAFAGDSFVRCSPKKCELLPELNFLQENI